MWNFHPSAFGDFLRAQCDDETDTEADGNDATLHSLPTWKSNDEGSARYLMQVRRKLICQWSRADFTQRRARRKR
jgi:hypothetical protein